MAEDEIIAHYIRRNPTHQITVCLNVRSSPVEGQLRITIEQLQRPGRPKTLGIYVVQAIAEALALQMYEKPQAP